MTDSDTTTDEKVRLDMPAWLVEEFSDGSALVDADGKEILVGKGEWEYADE
jgi:hypothetical protein